MRETRKKFVNGLLEIPKQLLVNEVNGKFVHECLPIQSNETFKAINQQNPNDIAKLKLSHFSGKLNPYLGDFGN